MTTADPRTFDSALLDILVCPRSRTPLHYDEDAQELRCTRMECGLVFPVRDGIPVLLVDEARQA